MKYEPIQKLAERGFLFAPTGMGMTRSDRTDGLENATSFSRGNANAGRPASIPVDPFSGGSDMGNFLRADELIALLNDGFAESSKIIGLIHSNKLMDVDALGEVSGATSLGASIRAVWGFSKDPVDKDKFHMADVNGMSKVDNHE